MAIGRACRGCMDWRPGDLLAFNDGTGGRVHDVDEPCIFLAYGSDALLIDDTLMPDASQVRRSGDVVWGWILTPEGIDWDYLERCYRLVRRA
jgi:hypothetical protein